MNEAIEHKKLRVAYEALQAENLTLKEEVAKLRRQLGVISEKEASDAQIPTREEINFKVGKIEERFIRSSPLSTSTLFGMEASIF